MRYYAVAVGRQQRVTSKYRDFKYLVKNYPDAYYTVTEDYEQAERFIRQYNEGIKKQPSHTYEENVSYKPSHQTRFFTNTSVDNTIWITACTKTTPSSNTFNQDFQIFTHNPMRYASAVTYSVSTKSQLRLKRDKYVKDLIDAKDYNYYENRHIEEDTLYDNHNKLLLTSLTDILNNISEAGESTALICTDSHYLTHVIMKDMTRRKEVNSIPLANLNEIILLYKAMHNFDKIFITRYGVHEKSTLHHKILKHTFEKAKGLLEVKN